MRRTKLIALLVVTLVITTTCGLVFFGCNSVELITGPMVIDAGAFYENDDTEYYSVVWGAAKQSMGYVTYTYGGQDYKVYAETEGKATVGKVLSAHIPREHLTNNKYRTNTCRVKAERAYYPSIGNPKISEEYSFKGDYDTKENVIIGTMSDWHGELNLLNAAAEKLYDDIDLLVMLGDAGDLIAESVIVNSIIKAGGDVSKGVVPIIYVRGNHETRGKAGHNLASMLGMSSLYYQLERGDFMFTVLDIGEDKDDSHKEYGGLAAFAQYHERQTKWIESLDNSKSAKYNILLSHSVNFCGANEDYAARWRAKAEAMNIDMIVGGHSHAVYRIRPGNNEDIADEYRKYGYKATNYLQIEGGGLVKNVYTASKFEFKDGGVKMTSANSKGQIVEEWEFAF